MGTRIKLTLYIYLIEYSKRGFLKAITISEVKLVFLLSRQNSLTCEEIVIIIDRASCRKTNKEKILRYKYLNEKQRNAHKIEQLNETTKIFRLRDETKIQKKML